MKIITINDVRAAFEARGYTLLDEEYKGVHSKVRYMCPEHGEQSIRVTNLLQGRGCNECAKIQRGLKRRTHNITHTRLFNIWSGMKQRCYNPNAKSYIYCGSRGITVCDEWHDPCKFFEWALTNGYEEHLTIDRKDNDGNYEPSNCRWATYHEQRINQRRMSSLFLYVY